MSVEAISWALNLAPVPAGQGGQPSSACKFVLVGLANHAGPDGTAAFPSVATLVRYTGLSERTVRTCLDRLEADGIIAPCDPDIVAARIKRADRRPKGWDLDLSLNRDAMAKAGTGEPERPAEADKPGCRGPSDGVQPPHPEPGAVNNPDRGVRPLHPGAGPGCNQRSSEVQSVQPRGAAAAPEPYEEPAPEPSAARAPARETPPAAGPDGGGGQLSEFFAALGDRWPLTTGQQTKLGPAVTAALDAGWTAPALAAFTGANTDGVRSPYAVLAGRLAPAELPPPPCPRPPRPPWCGHCDERTRRRQGADGADAGRCPDCHPLAGEHASTRSSPTPTGHTQRLGNQRRLGTSCSPAQPDRVLVPPVGTGAGTKPLTATERHKQGRRA